MTDILEELDEWIAEIRKYAGNYTDEREPADLKRIKCARDEIAALRGAAKLDRALIRDEALIEAAAAAGAAIRGLKR